MKNFLKGTLKILALLLVLLACGYAFMVFQNNRDVSPPDRGQLNGALESAIGWLQANRDALLLDDNQILWSFIADAAKLSYDPRLSDLVAQYSAQASIRNSPWHALLHPENRMATTLEEVLALYSADYHKHFMYALSCNEELAEHEIIQKQMRDSFCYTSPFISSCTTHQLMALDMMVERNCGDPAQNQALIANLQDYIELQLTLDPRVCDVYIQRLMMLAKTGGVDRIKPVWVQRMLDAQLADGAWEQFHPLIKLGGGYRFGFAVRWPEFRRERPSLHTTSQAILLLTILRYTDA